MKWVGKIFVPKDDTYEFSFDELDDAGRLFLDGENMIEVWRVQKSSPKSREIKLTKGPHNITIEYVQGPAFFSSVRLTWKSSSFAKETIGVYQSGGTRRAQN